MHKFKMKLNQMIPRRKFFNLSRRKAESILEELQEKEDLDQEKILLHLIKMPVQTACSTKPVERYVFILKDGIMIRSRQDWRVYKTPSGYTRLFMRDNSTDFNNPEWPCDEIEDETVDEFEEISDRKGKVGNSVSSHNLSSVRKKYGPPNPLKTEDGLPLRVWQGNQSSDILGADGGSEAGIFLTPRKGYARRYGSRLHETFVGFSRPLVVTNKGEISPSDLTHSDIRILIKKGFDGIIVKNENSPDEKSSEIVAFSKDSLLRDLDEFVNAKYIREDYDYSEKGE